MRSKWSLNTVTEKVSSSLENFSTAVLIFLCVIVFVQVVARFVLKVPTPWSEELARYILIMLVFLGTALSLRRRRHLTVANIFNRLPMGWKIANRIIISGVLIFLSIFLLVSSLRMSQIVGTETATSMVWFKMSYLHIINSLFFGLTALYALLDLPVAIRELKS